MFDGRWFEIVFSAVADAPWSATVFPAPQHPPSTPSSYRRPVPAQSPRVMLDAVVGD
jgi:hypothetical protein